ncbi:hypothetical protein J7E88_09580 [Streptomyces sp. ISL-10]|uniref:SCO2400 family protein n=1 Tax=Streptomyces sp. ISL-10 TaxID=2819172 RepID=UPI001BE95585|nr:hypothetical protein [Streptomyces sp. ISL-10]MBT2365561.1 hypothetical protein [Streptomyces sp. ISL-10]
MDYCSSCRRHLNGALVCPGCGAYAPDIAPPMHRGEEAAREPFLADRSPARRSSPGDAAPQASASARYAPGAAISNGAAADADGSPSGGPETSRTPGRAARRRQLARWKKNRRRAVAGTAIALVGGSLTVAALPSESSKGKANAVSAPDPVTPDAGRMNAPATASAEPSRPATRQPDTRPSPTAVPGQRTTAVTMARTAATPPPARTASQPAQQPETQRSDVLAPRPTAASTEQPSGASDTAESTSGSNTPVDDRQPEATPSQTATTSPTEVCLLVLCLG